MSILIAFIGTIIGYLLNNYAVTVDECEKGNVLKFKYDKIRTPIIILWNIISPLFLFYMYGQNISVNFLRDVVLSALCSAVFFIDFRLHIIPNILNLIAFLFGVIFMLLDKASIQDSLTGMCIGLAFFLIIIILSRVIYKKDGMGLGDT